MPEEVFETEQPRPEAGRPLDDGRNWPKIILVAVLGLGLLAASAYAGYWYETQEISKPTSTSSIVEDETGRWKMYTNAEYGYAVRYPSKLTPKEEPAADVFLIRTNFWDIVNDTVVFGIEVREASLAKAVEDIKDDHQKLSVIMELQREDKIVHQGYNGYRLEYESEATVGTDVIVIINNNTYSYLIRSDKDTVDQILSTFKFLD